MFTMTKRQILEAVQKGNVTGEVIGCSPDLSQKEILNIFLANIERIAIDGNEYGSHDINWKQIIPDDEKIFVTRSSELYTLLEEKYKSLYRTLYTNFDESIADSLKKLIEDIVKFEKEKCLLKGV